MTAKNKVTKCEACPHNHQARTWVAQQNASTNKAKNAAAENGKKGGRPRKSKCDPDEAMPGYYAKEKEECDGCAFWDDDIGCIDTSDVFCWHEDRTDGCTVIFLKCEEKKTP